MTKRIVTAKSPGELAMLVERDELAPLKGALSLLHSWGIHGAKYLPVLERLLFHTDPEVVRLTLGIMLNFERRPTKRFLRLRERLPTFQKLLGTQPLALNLIVGLNGPTRKLVPHLKKYLWRYPEEGCDLVYRFGPVAKELVPDLIRLIKKSKDWDDTWAAVDALGAIGPAAKKAVPVLKKLTKHKSGVITGQACVALERITGISRYSWPQGPDAEPCTK